MSVWFGAYQAVNDLLIGIRGLRNDTRSKGSTRWASLEGLSVNARGAASTLEQLPETHSFVAQIREIGDRYDGSNSVTNEELDADIETLKPITTELFRRMTDEGK